MLHARYYLLSTLFLFFSKKTEKFQLLTFVLPDFERDLLASLGEAQVLRWIGYVYDDRIYSELYFQHNGVVRCSRGVEIIRGDSLQDWRRFEVKSGTVI